MKFDVTKGDLQSALSILMPIVNNKTPLDILTHVLFEVEETEVYVTSTDLEIGAKIKIPATIAEKGSFTLPAQKCFDIVSSMPNESILFSDKKNTIEISCGSISFKLQTKSVEDYPVFANLEISDTKTIQTSVLSDILNNVLFAVSSDDSRYNLNSLYFNEHNGNPCVVATDGNRLAMQYVIDLPFPKKTLIPKSGCDYIRKFLLKTQAKELNLFSDTKNIMILTDSITIIIRLIEGDYPDISNIIPSDESASKILVNVDGVKGSVKRVSLMNDQTNRGMTVSIVDDTMEFSTNNPQIGSAIDKISITKTGEDCNFIVNYSYLLESISRITGDICEIKFVGEGKPILFSGDGVTEVFSMIMPMRK